MADAKDNEDNNQTKQPAPSTEQILEQQTENIESAVKDVIEAKSSTTPNVEVQDESPTAGAPGRSSRQRKNSTPNTPTSTPPSSRQITPPPTKQTPTPSPGGSTTSKSTPTPSPAGSSTSSKQGTPGKLPNRVGIQWKSNSRVEAKDFLGNWYPAKILEVDGDDITVLIHFEGWNSRYDEWIRMDSDRLRHAARHSERKEKKEKPVVKADHKVNECVFAKWTDCRMYAARIHNIKANGAYEVVFYDGFKKSVQPINIKPMPPDVQEQYGLAGWLPPPIKKNKILKREDLMAPKMKAEILNKHKKEKEVKKQQQQEGVPTGATEPVETGTTAETATPPAILTPEMPAVKVAKESEVVKEVAAKKRSPSTDKDSSEKKKETKRDKVNVSKTGVKTKEVIRSRLHEVQRSKIKQAREERMAGRPNSTSSSKPETKSERSDKRQGKGDASNKRKDRQKTCSPLKGKKLKIGGGFMFQTKRARIDALTAKINKAKEQRRHSAPPPTSTISVAPGTAIPLVSDPTELTEVQPEPAGEESSFHVAKEDVQLLSNSDTLVTVTQTVTPQPGKKKPQPLSITTSSGEQQTLVPLIPKSAPPRVKDGFPKKAFKVEEDHNTYKCPLTGCNKGFRKPSLVDYHVKYYHTSDGTPVRPPPPRKRKKTISVCSTDSEISVGGHKKKVRRDRGSGASLSSIPDTPLSDLPGQSSFDDSMTLALSEDGRTSLSEEIPTEFGDEETVSCDELYDKMEDEDFVNCICQIQEENGLMIQCDICLCWQHAVCMEITQETLPKKYVCYVCANPPGARDSARFISNQDWHREGSLARFNFLPVLEDSNSGRQSPSILATHNLVGDLHNVNHVLSGLRKKMAALHSKKGKELNIWTKNWDTETEKSEEDKIPELEQPKNEMIDEVKPIVKIEDGDSTEFITEVKTEPATETSEMGNEIEGQSSDQSEKDLTGNNTLELEEKNTPADEKIQKTESNGEAKLEEGNVTDSKEEDDKVEDQPMEVDEVKPQVPASEEETEKEVPSTNNLTANGTGPTESAPESQSSLEPQPSTSKLQEEEMVDPTVLCENNLLHHIIDTQDIIDTRLDDIELQLDELENLESNGARPGDILRDVPALKKAIHNLMNDLTKVKRMARFH